MQKITFILFILTSLWLQPSFATQGNNNPLTYYQIDSLLAIAERSTPEEMIRIGKLIDESLGNQPSLQKGNANEIIGLGLYNQNKYLSAISEFEEAIEIYSLLSDSSRISRMYNRIGVSYTRLRQYAKAMENYRVALRIRESLADTLLIGSTLNNIATCFRSLGQEQAAIRNHLLSFNLFKAINDSIGQATSLNNIGLIHFDLMQYDSSLLYFNQALQIKVRLNDTSSMANTYGNIGRVYTHLKNKPEAIRNLNIALALFEKTNNSFGKDYIHSLLGQAYLDFNQPNKAFEFISRNQSLSEYKENSAQSLTNLKLLSDYYWAVGNFKKSREILNDYLKKSEQLFSDRISTQIAELSFMYDNDRLDQENNMLEVKLELEKLKVQKAQYQQIALYSISILLLAMLTISLVLLKRIRSKRDELTLVNSELNHLNNHLETIVENRTRDLLSTLKKAQESDKQKSAFLANMSHEVRTPLNSIIGFTKLLHDENLPAESRIKYVDIIQKRGRKLLEVINDIVTISLLDLGEVKIKPIPFNLNQLLFDLYKAFQTDTDSNKQNDVDLKLTVSLSDSKSNIISDPKRLEQILINLIDFALKSTSNGFVEFGYSLENSHIIKFYVKDTGRGIADEHKGSIFTLTNDFKPSPRNINLGGLSLTICKNLVELLNGKIWFDSAIDAGTTFYFTIPYIKGVEQTSRYLSKSSLESLKLNFTEKVILVVEDDLISFQFIEALLKETDAQLIHAKNGEDAIEICKIVPKIDLVLMDMRLPFVDGYQATSEIKAIRPDIKIIAQTANVMSEDKTKCLSVGCDEYLSKPLDPDELLRVVAQYLSHPVNG